MYWVYITEDSEGGITIGFSTEMDKTFLELSRRGTKTGKTKSTTTQNEKYKINVLQQQNEKYKGGAKNKLPPFYLSTLNHRLTAT